MRSGELRVRGVAGPHLVPSKTRDSDTRIGLRLCHRSVHAPGADRSIVTLVRRFKTQAEKLAETAWQDLGIVAGTRFDMERFAEALGARIVMADDLVPRARLEEIDHIQPFAFCDRRPIRDYDQDGDVPPEHHRGGPAAGTVPQPEAADGWFR